jgi:hypothetical protein
LILVKEIIETKDLLDCGQYIMCQKLKKDRKHMHTNGEFAHLCDIFDEQNDLHVVYADTLVLTKVM